MDKTEERPVTFYIFKSFSESLPYTHTYIYIQEVNISIVQEHTFHFNKIQEEIALRPPYAFKRVSIDGSANCF